MPAINALYYYLHAGGGHDRPPVILIHGAGGSHLSWPAEIRRMSGYRVFTPDLPGHGRSGGVGKQSAAEYAAGLLQFMNDVSLWKAVLVGHSMGGAIALALAAQSPERVAGLGLIATGARLPVDPALLESSSTPSMVPLALQTMQAWLFSPGADPRVKEQAARLLAETRPAVLHGDLLACSNFDMSDSLETLRFPTLVLCGTEDRMTPLNLSKQLANHIPNAALQTIDGAGHQVMLEQPHRVMALLSVFLKTIPYTPGA